MWLKDPYVYFTGEYDMWVQEDAIMFSGSLERFEGDRPALPLRHKHYALCTCFMMVRPTRASRRLIHRWSRHVRAQVSAQAGPFRAQVSALLRVTAPSSAPRQAGESPVRI